MKKKLTEKQQKVLDFIRFWNTEKQMSPTLQQMAEHFGVKCSTIAYHVEALRKKGRLDRTSESRSIVLKEQFSSCQRKECQRKIGIRSRADAEPDGALGTVLVPEALSSVYSMEQIIAYRMHDDSMFGLGIHCGDILLIVPVSCRKPEPGDVVMAVTPDGRTLIRSYYLFSTRKIELVSSDSDSPPETYPISAGVLRGVVAALLRNY